MNAKNPNGDTCEDAACDGKFIWDDDQSTIAIDGQSVKARSNNGHTCLALKTEVDWSGQFQDKNCAHTARSVCQYTCPAAMRKTL